MTEEPLTAPERSIARTPRWLIYTVIVLLGALLAMAVYLSLANRAGPGTARSTGQQEIAELREALRQSPDDTAVQLELAYAYQQAGRLSEALDLYDRVLAVFPTQTAALYGKGSVLLALGDSKGAERVLWEVLEINEGHVLAAQTLGEMYAGWGHYRSLIKAVRPAVVLNESSAELQFLMGLAYENLGQREWAEARYRLALEHYPDMPQARAGLERLGAVP
ncbi:MAG: tetratricopeptide repeat protein [Anaerosomatales bacterium]|nr:tetratricopeptide repeat protein [Anaerosomatales bacterium]